MDNEIIKVLKEKFSEALRSTGKTAKEIAELTGMNYRTILRYMNGIRFPKIDKFDEIVNTLNLDESKIMRYDLVNEIIDEQKKK